LILKIFSSGPLHNIGTNGDITKVKHSAHQLLYLPL